MAAKKTVQFYGLKWVVSRGRGNYWVFRSEKCGRTTASSLKRGLYIVQNFSRVEMRIDR